MSTDMEPQSLLEMELRRKDRDARRKTLVFCLVQPRETVDVTRDVLAADKFLEMPEYRYEIKAVEVSKDAEQAIKDFNDFLMSLPANKMVKIDGKFGVEHVYSQIAEFPKEGV